ncbi:hypothetical protein [Promicromonospora sp. NFX87]|uniref:hypothetical protein n=1 Tax=Promicromonospora sp. NFX87 TaxID=3402691 RepID=UPI003AFA7A74
MRPETWALLGVAVGAAISGLIQFMHLLVQRRWAVADSLRSHDLEREARLFDHRRVAYVEFMEQFRKTFSSTDAQVNGDVKPLEFSDPIYAELSAAAERVSIYGSESAHEVAHEATFAVGVYWLVGTNPDRSEEPGEHQELRDQLHKLLEDFRTVARRDLGVEMPRRRSKPQPASLPWPGLETVSEGDISEGFTDQHGDSLNGDGSPAMPSEDLHGKP